MVTALKLVAAVLLYVILKALTPDFHDPVGDGLATIGLAIASIVLVFWMPVKLSKTPKS